MNRPDMPYGFLLIDKPLGMTSHDVVAMVRRGANLHRVGHAGTLDPLATGLLVVCLGPAARLSEYVMYVHKTYVATLRLGIETDSYDGEGQIVAQTDDLRSVTPERIAAALTAFQGVVQQIPPMFSAVRRDGKRLYELARRGQEVERPAREVWMQVRVLEHAAPNLILEVECSAGTYIRSLAHDLGAALGVGAYLTGLNRTRIGSLTPRSSVTALKAAFADGTWREHLVDERVALAHFPALTFSAEASARVLNGVTLDQDEAPGLFDPAQPLIRAYDPAGRFLAILRAEEGQWRPGKVFLDIPS